MNLLIDPKIKAVSCTTLKDEFPICKACQSPTYIWFEIEDGRESFMLCSGCKEAYIPSASKVDIKKLYNFFQIIFEETIKLKRADDLLLVTNTNRRVIEGGLVSRELTIHNLRPLINAGIKESLIEAALDFSTKAHSCKLYEPSI